MKEIIGSTRSSINPEIDARYDDTSCGPTCLHAVYAYYNDNLTHDNLTGEVQILEGGGSLAAFMGCHAHKRGYRAVINV